MRLLSILLCLAVTQSWAQFMTKDEYAKMLYQNPRGVGCDQCHGEKGEGMVMSIYIKNGKETELRAPRINNLGLHRFRQAFKHKSRVMPTYSLTDVELAYIYYYLSSLNQNQKGEEK